MKSSHALTVLLSLTAVGVMIGTGCGSELTRAVGEDPTGVEGGLPPGFGGDAGEGSAPCTGLRCKQEACSGGGDTTVTGTVFAPNGKLPLYNAIVYVPNAAVAPIVKGATCDKCGAVTGDPIVTALTGPDGKFTLKNVPIGTNIPLVIQVGKWRRQVVLPEVRKCTENVVADPELTRLPKNQKEGDIPQIALTTGGCDKLGCMLPKVGIDASEFGLEADGAAKAVHVYNGSTIPGRPIGPGAPLSAKGLWNDLTKLKTYDMVILSCECQESREGGPGNGIPPSKGATSFAAMTQYLDAGGRIFTTDFMYTWYRHSPDPGLSSATVMRGNAPQGGNPMTIDATFPKGKALSDWLGTVTPGSNGKVTADVVFGNLVSTDPMKSQQWARSGADEVPEGPRVFSVNVPVGKPADQQCGKGVHIDAHLNDDNAAGGDRVDPTYPKGCTTNLKEGEKLLAFFFFDLASCIQNETEAPKPPDVVK